MYKRKPLFGLTVVAMILFFGISAWAGTTGKIAGVVIDRDTGEPLPGVNVLIVGTTTGAATNIQGEFFIINVPPGNYSLRASLIGYGPVEIKNVPVSVDLTTDIRFELSTQTIEMGTIVVEAERPLIEKDITSSRTSIAPSQITESAVDGIVNRVNFTAGSVLGSFRGGRINQGEIVYLLDGTNLSHPLGENRIGENPGSGTGDNKTALATFIPNEAIAEAEVLTGGFGAEYPNVQSAVVNIVTKEGGDALSGKIKSKSSPEVLFGTDTKVDGKNRSNLFDMRQHEFSLGGPVPIASIDIPGRMSFFTSGIYQFNRSYEDPRSWEKSQSVQGKLTYQITSSKKLTISGLRSFGSSVPWRRSRMLRLSWGEPTYYTRSDVDITTGEIVEIDTFYTPYSWIMAPGHQEGEISEDLLDYWKDRFSLNDDWPSDSVSNYLDSNFGFSALADWAGMPDSLRDGAADYIEDLGYARRYTNYDMANTMWWPHSWSNEVNINFTNNISTKTYYNIGYSRFHTEQRIRVYDPWDGHPLSPDEFADPRIGAPPVTAIQSQQLRANPMYISRFSQDDYSTIQTFRGDLTSQINSYNLIKFGGELKWFDVFYDYRSYASGRNEYNSQYHMKPFQVGMYAQDKVETEGMIVNVGLRYDYFDPKTIRPFNLADPLNSGYDDVNNPLYTEIWSLEDRLKNPVSAKKKQQLSPRVGISFPITDKDVLHVTYGHYFQLPVFDDFYTNLAYDLRGAFKYIGNPDLKEQKTVAYEAGVEHGFNDYLKLAVTGFFKDIADLTSYKKYRNLETGGIFWIYTNADYARVKGFEITFSQRPWRNLSGIVTYTYQIARGRASDKTQAFLDDYATRKPRTEDFPLDWDQRHTAKVNVNYRTPVSEGPILGDWGVDAVWVYGSGEPYTGVATVVPPNLPPINNKRFPATWRIDLRVDKGISVYKNYNVKAFVEVVNLTDRANIQVDFITVTVDLERYELTGDPAGQFGDPAVYSPPRRILLGMQLLF